MFVRLFSVVAHYVLGSLLCFRFTESSIQKRLLLFLYACTFLLKFCYPENINDTEKKHPNFTEHYLLNWVFTCQFFTTKVFIIPYRNFFSIVFLNDNLNLFLNVLVSFFQNCYQWWNILKKKLRQVIWKIYLKPFRLQSRNIVSKWSKINCWWSVFNSFVT